MAISLDTFLSESREELVAFEAWWKAQHAKAPEQYPMTLPMDNAGLWWEMLNAFVDDRPDLAEQGE